MLDWLLGWVSGHPFLVSYLLCGGVLVWATWRSWRLAGDILFLRGNVLVPEHVERAQRRLGRVIKFGCWGLALTALAQLAACAGG